MNELAEVFPFSWWRTRRARKHAREVLKHVRRLLASHRDLMSAEKISAAEESINEFAACSRGSLQEIEQGMEKLERNCNKLFPTPKHARYREMIEIALVAAVVAWGGIRTFFLQPFKIPTGSMQPTLYGVHIEPIPAGEKVPVYPLQLIEKALMGRGYVNVIAEEKGELSDIRTVHSGIGLFASISSVLTVGSREYTVPIEPDMLARQLGVRIGQRFKAGDPIVRCTINNGDHIFVDKVTYNFRHPRRGEVFVFETKGIEGTRGEFYIKRLAGVGGDTLRIAAPKLYVNGEPGKELGFVRVMSGKNRYEGYTNPDRGMPPFGAQYLTRPEDTYNVLPKTYFALGDNSGHSADSRFWGPVPHANLVGRAFFDYWPFTRRTGLVD